MHKSSTTNRGIFAYLLLFPVPKASRLSWNFPDAWIICQRLHREKCPKSHNAVHLHLQECRILRNRYPLFWNMMQDPLNFTWRTLPENPGHSNPGTTLSTHQPSPRHKWQTKSFLRLCWQISYCKYNYKFWIVQIELVKSVILLIIRKNGELRRILRLCRKANVMNFSDTCLRPEFILTFVQL